MNPSAQTSLFAVTGRPVLHSSSPQLLTAALREAGLPGCCVRLAAQSAQEAFAVAREIGLTGMNVTSPFKEAVADQVEELDRSARRTGAVNAVAFEGGRTTGYNTDVTGVSEAFRGGGVAAEGKKALVLGTGGAARAAVEALQHAGAKVVVAGRDLTKASRIAGEWGIDGVCIDSPAFFDALARSHILVGCLSTPDRVVPAESLHTGLAVVDAYYARESALARDARERGCKVEDGREWLLHQAAASFRIFTGREAPLEAMRATLDEPWPHPKPNVALVGFMGCGKDAVASRLSPLLAMPVLDADAEVEKRAGMKIAEIFRTKGEEAFRDLESGVLRELDSITGRIVGCGGGAVLREENRRALRESCTVVWLWASPETVLSRVPRDGARPLLDVEDPPARVRKLLMERTPLYADSSDLVVPTGGKSPEAIAERIADEIRQAFGRLG